MTEFWIIGVTLAALGSGLMAGTFYVFSIAVMPAFRRIGAPAGMAAMQEINKVIVNPVFLVPFFGTGVLGLILAAAALADPQAPGAWQLVLAAILYVGGCLGVTMARNVPMNRALAGADPAGAEGLALWQGYLARWTAWNHIRAAACLVALGLYIRAASIGA